MSRSIPLVLLLTLLVFRQAVAELKVVTDFEGGSADVLTVSSEQRHISVRPTVSVGRGFPCWWYFRVEGMDVGQTYTLTLQPAKTAYRNDEILSSRWATPDAIAISFDDREWKQTSNGERNQSEITYKFTAERTEAWLAWGPPFLPSNANELLARAKSELPSAEIFELAETRHQRKVNGIRFGAIDREDERPFGVWIQARQHAWEAGGSWVGQGFLLWAVGDDPKAIELRRNAIIHFIPIMDVDSVAAGEGGKNAIPRDHNRDWNENPVYPEVRAAQEHIHLLDRQGRFDLFIDLHNPGASERDAYFFGPNLKELSQRQRRNYDQFLKNAVQYIPKLQVEYRFPSYVRDREEYNRMSGSWVRNHTSEHVVSVTLETGWNRPEGTQTGYQQVGENLGRAVADYLGQNPRREDVESE